MRDRLLPNPLAKAEHRWHVQRALKHIFDYRRQQIARLFWPAASLAKPPVALSTRQTVTDAGRILRRHALFGN